MKNDSVEKSGRPAGRSACAWVLALARSETTTVPRVPRPLEGDVSALIRTSSAA